MKRPSTLFEVSWEVCHRIGAIHTVVSTKARRMAERLGDAYVMIGPWLLSSGEVRDFEPDPAFDSFAEGCRAAGVPVRVGRWKIPGNPRTILVEFSGLYQRKDEIFKDLWERHGVDSLFGGWDYAEPVLFGRAAGIVIQRWSQEVAQGAGGPAVAHFQEWMTGAGLLYLADQMPEIGTVFTSHATVLGRALAATGVAPLTGLGDRTPDQAAEAANVRAPHSLEAATSREADVFTTVSDVGAEESRLFHGRDADPVLPNGWDDEVMRTRVGGAPRERSAAAFRDVASRFLGEDVSDAAIVVTTGRYEFHNKGFDLLLDAASDVNARAGRRMVVFLFVPAGNSGIRREMTERMRTPTAAATGGALGISTHALFDDDGDAIARRCRERGLDNRAGNRVRIVHVAEYVSPEDGLFRTTYEALLQGADLTVFPSFYDAWGYTPQESLALGVPTITSDCTGFGRWMLDDKTPRGRGLTVLRRRERTDARVRTALAAAIERHLEGPSDDAKWAAWCRELAAKTGWEHLVARHEQAHHLAREIARKRSKLPAGRAAAAPNAFLPKTAAAAARPHVFPLDVAPNLPPAAEPLRRLIRNWHWTWDPEAREALRALSPATWERVGHDATRLLREAPQQDVELRCADPAWTAQAARAVRRQDEYLALGPDEPDGEGPSTAHPVAYVCAEYGLHESLPIYSGGLGALAGDHLKSASDLRLPLVAVGLLYRKGYMRQRLEGGTEQVVLEERLDPAASALEPVVDAAGKPVEVTLILPGTTLVVRAWRADVGRVPLYLLDTDVEANRPEDRGITHALYAGDTELRLRQEIVLGFGSIRLLGALGIEPSCVHVNEGHGAFAALERVRTLVREHALSFDEAREVVRGTTIFTTHTPVPAGHDRFAEDLMRRYFSDVADWLKTPWERFLALGTASDAPHLFNMTRLAVEFAAVTNGVSWKHGEVSRALLRSFSPSLLEDEVPVAHVTNGVHVGGWTHGSVAALLGAEGPATGEDFRRSAGSLDPAALWGVRRALRRALLAELRTRLARSAAERGDGPLLLARMLDGLSEDALVIGFARRFATYKRADLVLRDPARLKALLDAPGRPVRLVFAGKAHPRDAAARELLSRIAKLSRTDDFAGRVFVVENYDLSLARALVAGVDVWLNNPRAPLEASGTSGMKAACNGALNLSVADGWWLEAFDGNNGWTVGDDGMRAGGRGDDGSAGAGGSASVSEASQDARDFASLFALLEHDVVPLFFDRDAADVPRRWTERVRRSMATIPPVFDTARMVAEYRGLAYRPLGRRFHELRNAACASARTLAARRARIHKGLAAMRIASASVGGCDAARPGDVLNAQVDVALGELTAGDVVVELVVGRRDDAGEIRAPQRVPLPPAAARAGDLQRFEGSWTVPGTGAWAYGLRVRPHVEADDAGPAFHDPVLWA